MKKIIFFFIIWRIGLFAISSIAPHYIPVYGEKFPYRYILFEESKLPNWLSPFGGFDGVYYLRLAKDGYEAKFTQVFFPLYPILIRILSDLTLNNLLGSALIISNLSFLGSLVVFYKLIKKKFDESTAFWSSLFLIFSPTSFYFGSVYTESIFFLFMVLAFYLYENEKFILASIFGTFSSLTRLIGVFLSVSLIKLDKEKKNLFSLFIVPIGLFIYMVYLKIVFNNPLYFLTAQTAFGQGRTTTQFIPLPQVYYRSIAQIFTTHGLVLYNSTLDFMATTICIILLISSIKLVPKNWIVFSFLAILAPTITGSFISMPRYILIAIPMFIVLGKIKKTWVKILLLILSTLVLTVNTMLFTRGYWIA